MRLAHCLAAVLAVASPSLAIARPVVAIIDGGVARTPALAKVLRAEYDEARSPARPAFTPRYDHGTMVASILNNAAQGGVDIISLRIDGEEPCPAGAHPPCQSSSLPIARAIDHAVALGVDAINLSLALSDDPAIVAAVSRATKQGIVVVMAAGNNGRDHPDNLAMARVGYPRAVLVGATGKDGKPWPGTNRPDAQTDGYVYVWQPGVSVPTTDAAGTAITATGTSFAAPIETAHRVLSATPQGGSSLRAK